MKAKSAVSSDNMRAEYDFDYSKAVRGKYYRRLLKEGANVVVLEPDVAKAFRSSAAVNEALRSLLRMSEATERSGTWVTHVDDRASRTRPQCAGVARSAGRAAAAQSRRSRPRRRSPRGRRIRRR